MIREFILVFHYFLFNLYLQFFKFILSTHDGFCALMSIIQTYVYCSIQCSVCSFHILRSSIRCLGL